MVGVAVRLHGLLRLVTRDGKPLDQSWDRNGFLVLCVAAGRAASAARLRPTSCSGGASHEAYAVGRCRRIDPVLGRVGAFDLPQRGNVCWRSATPWRQQHDCAMMTTSFALPSMAVRSKMKQGNRSRRADQAAWGMLGPARALLGGRTSPAALVSRANSRSSQSSPARLESLGGFPTNSPPRHGNGR